MSEIVLAGNSAVMSSPNSGEIKIFAKTNNRLYTKDWTGVETDLSHIDISGEVNTASNQGSGGVGLYDGKVASDLQFRNINAGSNKVTVTLDSGDKEVDLDVVPGNIDHNGLLNYVVGQHRVINDSGVTTTELWSANKISGEIATIKTSDVTGPISSTDNSIVRWDGTGGNTIQDSGIIIDNSDNVTGVNAIAVATSPVINGVAFNSTVSGEVGCSLIGIPTLGTPIFTNICDALKLFLSTGIGTGGVASDAGSENLLVTEGNGFIRPTNNATSDLLSFDWVQNASLATTTDTHQYVGITYNSGTPIIDIRLTDNYNYNTEFSLASVINTNGILHILNNPWRVTDGLSNIIKRFKADGYIVMDKNVGGLILSVTGTRSIAVTTGTLWSNLNDFVIPAIDTNVSGTIETYYYTGGVWGDASVSQYQITQWNDLTGDGGNGTLETIGNNKYFNYWVYAEADDTEISLVYPQATYTSTASAEAETSPTNIPTHIREHGILIGRIICKQGVDAPIKIESAWATVFSSSQAADHGNLAGLSDDDHAQYLLLLGRVGGQTIIGGTGSGDDLTLQTTSNGTKGSYIFSELTTANGLLTSNGSGVVTSTLTPSGLTSVSATTLTDGTASITGGNITGVGSITATTLTDGTASITAGAISGVTTITTSSNVGINCTASTLCEIQGAVATPGTLTLSTKETTIVDGNELGRINFQAPLETSGADAILVAGAIWAEAGDAFATDNNTTDLVFATASSGIATESLTLAQNLSSFSRGRADGEIRIFDGATDYFSIKNDTVDNTFVNMSTVSGDNIIRIFGTSSATLGLSLLDGKLGVGVTTPSTLCEIQGAVATPGTLTLSTKETTIVDGNELGRINFQAPLEADGGDAILVAGAIWAEAEGTFSSSSNATTLKFATGSSETATTKMTINSAGITNVVGEFTAGTKTFVIDHPVEPTEKILTHAVFEGPEHGLIYRGKTKLVDGKATINIDEYFGMTAGTFAALTQDVEVQSLQNKDGFDKVMPGTITADTFEIICENTESVDEIAWVIMAARKDKLVKFSSQNDDDGRLIIETEKEDPNGGELDNEEVETNEIEKDKIEEIVRVDSLREKKGYYRNFEAFGAELPTKTKTYKYVEKVEESSISKIKKEN